MKLARFKEIFPAAAKNDRIDTRKTLELFQLRDHLPMAARCAAGDRRRSPEENRRPQAPVTTQTASGQTSVGGFCNALHADLQAVCPGLSEITRDVGNYLVLELSDLPQRALPKLARLRRAQSS